MLEKDILDQLKSIFSTLETSVTLVVTGVSSRNETREMLEFARDFASVSDALSVKAEDAPTEENAPRLQLWRGANPTGVTFCGIPNGHEFSTLIMAVLNAAGMGRNLPDEGLRRRIERLQGPAEIFTFVSLSCTNCPDVAQALNIVALLNPRFTNTVIDGAVAPEMVKSYNVQSVPAVFANGQLLSVGRAGLGELVGKLESAFGTSADDALTDNTPLGYDAIVAGGGPAGAAAAIYLARKGLRTAVVAGRIGGQVSDTTDIENLISVPLTTGTRLAYDIRKHLAAYDIDLFDNRQITSVQAGGFPKRVAVEGGEQFEAPILIIATGASWRRMNVKGEAEYIGRGVAFCTHCDGPFFAGKDVAVTGGGNSGIEAAIDLAAICRKVDVFEFLDVLKADEVLQKKLATLDNVTVHLSSSVTEVEGDGKGVTGIQVQDRVSGGTARYAVQGVFVQIGLTPNSAPFAAEVPVNGRGEIETDGACRTKVAGVYAAGDVTDVPYKQIVIAMGEGAKAALSAVDDRMRGLTGD